MRNYSSEDPMHKIQNWIDGQDLDSSEGAWLENRNPHNDEVINLVTNSTSADVDTAVAAAKSAQPEWAGMTPVARGQLLGAIVSEMRNSARELANCVAMETGKPPQDAAGEVGGAILQGDYFAGEGMRLYGRSLTSGMTDKHSHTVRQPRGVAGLIVPANTPIANIAWKTFPALICGNSVVMKAAEDSPGIADLFAKITKRAGLPDGVFNVVHGLGNPAGQRLVEHQDIDVISFTGSTQVGRMIAQTAGQRLARVSVELGGKNPIVVCDDADLNEAAKWVVLSAFSNAGQRCASGSLIVVFDTIYDEFREVLLAATAELTLGVHEGASLGPVINRRQQENIFSALELAKEAGGNILCGGSAPTDSELTAGYYVQPTLVDGLSNDADMVAQELFGPVASVHRVHNIQEALDFCNAGSYGLTSAIHTTNVDRAMWFAQRVKAGVANVNMGTYGSEPHMPFGGFGASGNGTREPGIEALDVYSELKNISFLVRSNLVT
ncbi:MAG: aldehyde dehydrogenase family protein [Pseudomonadota bacterium]